MMFGDALGQVSFVTTMHISWALNGNYIYALVLFLLIRTGLLGHDILSNW